MFLNEEILEAMNREYPQTFREIDFLRDGGSLSYSVRGDQETCFLRVIRPELMETALHSLDIHVFLQEEQFPVPVILFTQSGRPYVEKAGDGGTYLLVLYQFIEGEEPSEADVEQVGELIGKLHRVMERYPKELKVQDKHFFIGRYVDILAAKGHPLTEAYRALGDKLWERVKDLPRGYCHCDLYRGNIHKAGDGRLYVLDFDTSCHAFPMYDVTLFCNETDYFRYSDEGFEKSRVWLQNFVAGYTKYRALAEEEIQSFYFLHAVYHFQLQATIVEIYGVDCNGADFEEKQLAWLHSWLDKAREAAGVEI